MMHSKVLRELAAVISRPLPSCRSCGEQGNSPITRENQGSAVPGKRNSGCILGCTGKVKSSTKVVISPQHLGGGLLEYCE